MSISQLLHDLLINWLTGVFNAPVVLQDQSTQAIDLYMSQHVDGPFTLNSDTVKDNRVVEVVTPHSLAAGDRAILYDSYGTQQLQVVSIVNQVGYDEITMDRPIDRVYTVALSEVHEETIDIAVDGSVTPQAFRFPNHLLSTFDITFDVTRIMTAISDESAMDDGLFGGIAALANGLVFRKVFADGTILTYASFKTNGGLGISADLAEYTDKAPSGEYGYNTKHYFGGQDRHGVVLRLTPGDYLEVIVQDDLTGLSSVHALASGHVTD